MIMETKDNDKQNNNNPIFPNESDMQRIENIIKPYELDMQRIEKIDMQSIKTQFKLDMQRLEKNSKQLIDRKIKYLEDAKYSKEQVLQLRANNDSRLYQMPKVVNHTNEHAYVWENGKVGYFIPLEHSDFIKPRFGGGIKRDGKGLRFVQIHQDSSKTFDLSQSSNIIISGFGEYVLENWGKDLSNLFREYTVPKHEKRVEQWQIDNYPNKISKQMELQLLNELKEDEQNRWEKASISEFFTAGDKEGLNQRMDLYFDWFASCIREENDKAEKPLIDFIQSGMISNRWANGKAGEFKDRDDNCQYSFYEYEDFDDNCLYRFYKFDEAIRSLHRKPEQKNFPVLTCGFVGWLIKHWGTDTQTIYSGYLRTTLYQYETEHKTDADVLRRDLEREFYDQYRAKEEQWVKQSEGIFDFISDWEVNLINDYVQNYFEYVSKFETKTNPSPPPKAAKKLESNTNKDNVGKNQQYTFDTVKITNIYNFCINTGVLINTVISNVDFINAVNTANFKTIYAHAEQQESKGKCKYIIFILSKFIAGDGWYLKTAHSINTEPCKCSGINVPSGWKKKANTIK
jgi:hypothetical protein